MVFKTEQCNGKNDVQGGAGDNVQRYPFILQDNKMIPSFVRLQLHNDIWSVPWLAQEIPVVLYILFISAWFVVAEYLSLWWKTVELFKHFDL